MWDEKGCRIQLSYLGIAFSVIIINEALKVNEAEARTSKKLKLYLDFSEVYLMILFEIEMSDMFGLKPATLSLK